MIWLKIIPAIIVGIVAMYKTYDPIFGEREDAMDSFGSWLMPPIYQILDGNYIEGQLQTRKFAVWLSIAGLCGGLTFFVLEVLF